MYDIHRTVSAFQVMSLSEIMDPSLTLRSKESVTDARKLADIENSPVSTPIIQGVGKTDVKTCYRRVWAAAATLPIIQGRLRHIANCSMGYGHGLLYRFSYVRYTSIFQMHYMILSLFDYRKNKLQIVSYELSF